MPSNENSPPTAIITGASGGIGTGLVEALLKNNYNVVATSRSVSKAGQFTATDNLVLVDGDISLKKTAVAVAETALKKFGRIDLLVNNAGIFVSKPFTEYTEEDFASLIGTNVASFFYMSQQVIPAMRKQKAGHIVNISTTLVGQPVDGVPASLQVLTKAAMPAVSRELAIEYARDNIRVNTVSPGVVNTPMHKESDHEDLKKLHPIQRLAEVSDIVDAVLYLTSATFVTGVDLHVDGGAHAGKW